MFIKNVDDLISKNEKSDVILSVEKVNVYY